MAADNLHVAQQSQAQELLSPAVSPPLQVRSQKSKMAVSSKSRALQVSVAPQQPRAERLQQRAPVPNRAAPLPAFSSLSGRQRTSQPQPTGSAPRRAAPGAAPVAPRPTRPALHPSAPPASPAPPSPAVAAQHQQQQPQEQQQQMQQNGYPMPQRCAPPIPPMGPCRRPSGPPLSLPNPSTFADDDPIENPQSSVAQQPEPDPVSSEEGTLSLVARIEYQSLARSQTQNVFGLVSVKANAPLVDAGEAERQPTDIVCILDVSGSMSNNNKIQHVKDAMKFLIGNSDPRDRLSIVAFNASASRVLRLRRMTTEGKDEANMSNLRLSASGGTSIASGLDMGLRVLEQRRQRNKVSAILLLTDGQDRSTQSRLPALIARARQEGCALYAFGFGSDHDASLLAEVAEHAQTPFTYVEDTENLQEIFAGAVGGLTSVVAQGVELTLTCHVPLKALHTPFAVQRDADGRRATVRIPDIFAGETRDFLVELEVPAGGNSGSETLLESWLRYTDLRHGCVVQTPVVTMQTIRVDEPQPELEPDEEVSAQRERVEVMQALQVATSHGDGGDFEQAQRVLSAAEDRQSKKVKKSRMAEALGADLADAKSRMASRSAYDGGGRAEVKDAMQMHNVQRCTNTAQSSKSMCKPSKAMYSSPGSCSGAAKSKSG